MPPVRSVKGNSGDQFSTVGEQILPAHIILQLNKKKNNQLHRFQKIIMPLLCHASKVFILRHYEITLPSFFIQTIKITIKLPAFTSTLSSYKLMFSNFVTPCNTIEETAGNRF